MKTGVSFSQLSSPYDNIMESAQAVPLLKYEFPPPIQYPGHGTSSTISGWALQLITLYFWTPNNIAADFLHYWTSTVTANDKNAPITPHGIVEWQINNIRNRQQSATNKLHIPAIFEMGIASAYKQAVLIRNPQPLSDFHSTIHLYEDVVFEEWDYLLQNMDLL